MAEPDFDIAILGGGLAGLSLGAALAARPGPALSTLVLEPRVQWRDGRVWSVFASQACFSDAAVVGRWPRWRIGRSDGRSAVGDAGPPLIALRVQSLLEEARETIGGSAHVRLAEGVRAGRVRRTAWGYEIETSAGALSARRVVDARPPAPSLLGQARWIQVLAGAEAEFARALFDPKEAGIALEMTGGSGGFGFIQVLPLSPSRARIEAVRISDDPVSRATAEATLAAALERLAGGCSVDILSREYAAAPLGRLAQAPGRAPAQAAGWLRVGAGAQALHVRAWAERAAKRLSDGRKPEPAAAARPGGRLADALIDSVILAKPQRAPDLLLRLAETTPPARFARVLAGEARPGDAFAVLRAASAVRSGMTEPA